MKGFLKKSAAVICIALTAAFIFHNGAAVVAFARKATAVSAMFLLPEGIDYHPSGSVSLSKWTVTAKQAPSQSAATDTQPPEGVETGKIQTQTLSLSGANTTTDQVHVSNKTDLALDLPSYLKQGLPFTLADTGQPQVLIVHTHATEAYAQEDNGYYIKSASTRSTDIDQNVVQVGEAIAQVLNDAGIVTINDTTLHDSPNYTGSYTRSAQTIREYLEKYPTIQVVIDGHRDAIAQSDGTKIKPTVEIGGKNAAQIMLLAGCQTGSVEDYPNWEQNFRLNLQLQRQIEEDYPGLARPLLFKACKYNFDLLPGSMLIEIGTDANTLEEAVYSGRLLGHALAKILQPA